MIQTKPSDASIELASPALEAVGTVDHIAAAESRRSTMYRGIKILWLQSRREYVAFIDDDRISGSFTEVCRAIDSALRGGQDVTS